MNNHISQMNMQFDYWNRRYIENIVKKEEKLIFMDYFSSFQLYFVTCCEIDFHV